MTTEEARGLLEAAEAALKACAAAEEAAHMMLEMCRADRLEPPAPVTPLRLVSGGAN